MKNFKDIIGQESIKTYFQGVMAQDKIAHAYLLEGEQSSGKEFIANIVAMTAQCTDKQTVDGMIQPCGKCQSCMQTMTMNQPDVIYVTHEKDNSISVEEVRTQINDTIHIKPYSSRYKIYIVSEADKMTPQAQNALLKTLEEPPSYAIILLLITNVEKILDTISSRCVMLRMQPVSETLLKKYLLEEVQIPDYKVSLCIAFARGNLGKAKKFATSDYFDTVREETLHLLKYMKDMEVNEIIAAIEKIKDYQITIEEYLGLIGIWYRDILLFKATNDVNHLVFKQETTQIKSVADVSDYEGIERILQAIDKAQLRLRANVKPDLAIELLMLTIREN